MCYGDRVVVLLLLYECEGFYYVYFVFKGFCLLRVGGEEYILVFGELLLLNFDSILDFIYLDNYEKFVVKIFVCLIYLVCSENRWSYLDLRVCFVLIYCYVKQDGLISLFSLVCQEVENDEFYFQVGECYVKFLISKLFVIFGGNISCELMSCVGDLF